MNVRRLTPEDAGAWRALRLEMLKTCPSAFGTTYAEALERPISSYVEWLKSINLFAADDEGLVGSVGWYPMAGNSARHRAHVIAVYVRAANRGAGVIDALLVAVAEDARSTCLQLELDVAKDNMAAIKAYARNGFDMIGDAPRAMCHGGVYVDAITMMRRLDA